MSLRIGLAAVLVALLMAGCSEPSGPPAAGTLQDSDVAVSGGTTVMFVDGSASFQRFAPDYEPEFTEITETVASCRGRILASIIDGQPLTTARIVSADFTETPAGGSDPAIRRRFNQAKALGLTRKLKLLVRRGGRVSGSGQLEALELAAATPSLRAVVFWTDAIINQPDGFDMTRASDNEIKQVIRGWAPRLRGLRGRSVVMLGVGRGVSRTETVVRAKRLFVGLAVAVGFRLYWAQSLAQLRG